MPGGYGRGYRYRWWYRATGLPGWMRFGYPPHVMWYPPVDYPGSWPMMYPEINPEEELHMLEEERQMLEEELEAIKKRIEEIKKELKEVK
ncbi:MAG TPA: hypothetical protein ENG24_01510 [Thermoplasmatales archaeon]|nr:hypothetical protein [Thermoplasmatales archaeon]